MTTEDERLATREPIQSRRQRASDDRALEDRSATENRELTDAERVAMFQRQLYNDVLPNLPPIQGYHTCWLTTNNPQDSIHHRMRLGYEPIKASDVPGLDYITIKTGEYAGLIGINEMIAFKLPMALYKQYMQIAHHDVAAQNEESLNAETMAMRQQAERQGARLDLSEGHQDIAAPKPRLGQFEGVV